MRIETSSFTEPRAKSTEANPDDAARATASASAPKSSLASHLPPDWRKALSAEFDKPYFKELEKFVANERRRERQQRMKRPRLGGRSSLAE